MRNILMLTIALSFFMVVLDSEAGPRKRFTGKRQLNQLHRIQHGVKEGSLTKGETRQLLRQQRNIQQAKKQALRDDGMIDNKEMAKIQRKQNRSSRRIFRKKHNDQNQSE